MNALPVKAPRNRYRPRKLTPKPNPSRAVLRVQRPPRLQRVAALDPREVVAERECVLLEACGRRSVPASAMLVGRFVPAVNWNDGKPRRSAPRLGAFSMPSWRSTSARQERALPPRVVVVVAGAELVDHRRREDLGPAADRPTRC